jgi:hypothetical protein
MCLFVVYLMTQSAAETVACSAEIYNDFCGMNPEVRSGLHFPGICLAVLMISTKSRSTTRCAGEIRTRQHLS